MLAVHGSGVRYSRGPKEHTPFSPTPVCQALFYVRVQGQNLLVLGYLVAHEAPVCTARVVLVARQTTTYPSLSTYYFHFKMESGRRKWRNYVHSYTYPADGARRTFLTNVCLFSLKESKCIFEDASIHGLLLGYTQEV